MPRCAEESEPVSEADLVFDLVGCPLAMSSKWTYSASDERALSSAMLEVGAPDAHRTPLAVPGSDERLEFALLGPLKNGGECE